MAGRISRGSEKEMIADGLSLGHKIVAVPLANLVGETGAAGTTGMPGQASQSSQFMVEAGAAAVAVARNGPTKTAMKGGVQKQRPCARHVGRRSELF